VIITSCSQLSVTIDISCNSHWGNPPVGKRKLAAQLKQLYERARQQTATAAAKTGGTGGTSPTAAGMPLDAQGDSAAGTPTPSGGSTGGATDLKPGREVSLGAVGDLLDNMIGRAGSSGQGGKK
jgi:hypothetical protein